MSDSFAKGVTWDLSDLYHSSADPRIEKDLKLAETKAAAFEKKYKPLFQGLEAPQNGAPAFPLFDLLNDYKEIATLMTKPGVFAQLTFSEKTDHPGSGAFMQKIQTRLTEIQTHLLFFEVSWNRLPDARAASLMKSDARLQNDLHLLQNMSNLAPHTLSEAEEKIMAVKSNTGVGAFSRLFDETLNSIPFYLEAEGQKIKKTEGEVLSLLHSPDRAERKKASESLAEGLKNHARLLTFIYNMILADHRSSMKIRNFKHPMDARNLANEIDLQSVQNLVRCVKEAYPIAQRYYRLKKKLLGLDKLFDYDRYAPIAEEETKLDFNRCKEIVLSGYRRFSPEVERLVEPFFSKRWIDAEVREGKQGGGFCCQTTPDLHPYVLVNYTGSLRDVMTVAHELGHGLHQLLSGKVGILESSAPLTMAETASVFGEMLIFEKILEEEKDSKKRLALLCGKIDDNFATVFRQIAMTDFEIKSHEAGLAEGELSAEKLSDLWIAANSQLYGDSVDLTEAYRNGWQYIPHFVHTPFYCYAYAFAQLFVLSLFQKYKENPQGFIPQYLHMLSLGGSKKPEEIAWVAGLNLKDPEFWNAGIKLLDAMVSEAEKNPGLSPSSR